MTADRGLYVYAVSGAVRPDEDLLDGLAGIDGEPVRSLRHGTLCALASTVSLAALRAVQDAPDVAASGWLEQAARAHERVTLRALDAGPVLPLRFGTVYPDGDTVTATLRTHEQSLLAELGRLRDATEWSIKVSLAAESESESAAAVGTGSGTSWLLARQARLNAGRVRRERLAECVAELRTALRAVARAGTGSESAVGGERLVRLAFLVADVPAFRAAYDAVLARYAGTDLVLRLDGPWPPYHFVRPDPLSGGGDG